MSGIECLTGMNSAIGRVTIHPEGFAYQGTSQYGSTLCGHPAVVQVLWAGDWHPTCAVHLTGWTAWVVQQEMALRTQELLTVIIDEDNIPELESIRR